MVYSTQQEILYILNSHCHPQRKMQHFSLADLEDVPGAHPLCGT